MDKGSTKHSCKTLALPVTVTSCASSVFYRKNADFNARGGIWHMAYGEGMGICCRLHMGGGRLFDLACGDKP